MISNQPPKNIIYFSKERGVTVTYLIDERHLWAKKRGVGGFIRSPLAKKAWSEGTLGC